MTHDTIADLLLDRLGDERPGLRTREQDWTWDEVVQESAARASLAAELRRDGPFHIGVLLDNVPEYVFWLGAAALCGATIVGVNSTRRGATLEQEVRHTDLQLMVTDRAGQALLDGLDIGVPSDRFLLVDDEAYAGKVTGHTGEPVRDPSVTARTQYLLLFTSGTTGASKAARCSQGRLTSIAHIMGGKYDVTRDDVSYCLMPLFHGNALMALWAPSLAAGATVVLTPKFSATGFLADVRYFGATFFSYVGKAVAYVLATPERPDDGDNPLTHAFGTEASPKDQAAFARRFGCPLTEGYGSSETGGLVLRSPEAPPTALGRPASDAVQIVDPRTREICDRAVLDEHGRVTNAEEAVGELVEIGGAARFEGYYKNPEADAERIRHGWYWTGDLGYVDEAGFLYFAGRSGDWIRVDSENISALPTQNALRRHPRVIDAAAFGVPDPTSGDQVMVAVEVAEGTGFDDLDLPAFLAGQSDLGTKGAPRFVRVSYALPTTGSGKLAKRQLQLEGWRAADSVYRWVGRGAPTYRLMTEDDKTVLREEFVANGRQSFLP
jgi:steroid-22-oyl-CoA synthetase